MIWQAARVVDRDADRLTLRFSAPEACERCARGDGCGAGNFARLFGRRDTQVVLPAELVVAVGERVRVGLEPGHLALAAVVHYGIALAGFLLGAVAGHAIAGDTPLRDPAALASGLAGLVVVARWVSPRLRPTWNPVVAHLSCPENDTNSASRD